MKLVTDQFGSDPEQSGEYSGLEIYRSSFFTEAVSRRIRPIVSPPNCGIWTQ